MKVMVIVMERVSIQLKFNVIVIVIQCITFQSSWPQVCIIYDLNNCQLRSYWIHLKLWRKAHTTS